MKRECDVCEGKGRIQPVPYDETTFQCHNGCDNGFFPPEPRDLDGRRARFFFATGQLTWNRLNNTLTLEDDLTGMSVMNLRPDDVELLR